VKSPRPERSCEYRFRFVILACVIIIHVGILTACRLTDLKLNIKEVEVGRELVKTNVPVDLLLR
jgi:hypothetical protein